MPSKIVELAVFISCPTNLNELRGVAEAAIVEVSKTLRVTNNIVLTPISWREDIVPGVATDGQEVINAQTLGKYDIYLGMLGSRFGTATARAGSGTEEEFDLAIARFQSEPTALRILFYLQAFGINPFDLEPSELQKVMNFRSKLQGSGVLYKELTGLDDALASMKSHVLKLVTSDWDFDAGHWKVSKGAPLTDSVQVLQTMVSIVQPVEPLETNDVTGELGLMELQMIGVNELALSGSSIVKLGANLDSLSAKTGTKFGSLSGMAPGDIVSLIDDYANDMDEFVAKSRGELSAARFHLSRGADHIELLYEQSKQHSFKLPESAKELIETVDGIEPSLRQFRAGVLEAKQAVEKLPPMTRRFKLSKNALVEFFDVIALELTLLLERLSLLKARLANTS